MGGHELSGTWWEHDGGCQQRNETWIEKRTVKSDIVRFLLVFHSLFRHKFADGFGPLEELYIVPVNEDVHSSTNTTGNSRNPTLIH